MFSRLKAHEKDFLWNRWEYFSWVGFAAVNTNGALFKRQKSKTKVNGYTYGDALNEIEGVLIEFIEPKLNKQSGRLKGAKEYLQYIDPQIDLSNTELASKLDKLERRVERVGEKISQW